MSRRVEGVNASYVGPDDQRVGVRTGDRCHLVSDEGQMFHVRWITGACEGKYGTAYRRDIVADIAQRRYDDDEFMLEAGHAPQRMMLNVAALHAAGGDVALFEAMESEGHLDTLRATVATAVHSIRLSMASDQSWDSVREALGYETLASVQRSAIVAAVIAAVESDAPLHTGDDDEEDGDREC